MWLKYIISSAPQSLQKIFILIVGRLQKKVVALWVDKCFQPEPGNILHGVHLNLEKKAWRITATSLFRNMTERKNTLKRTVREKSKTRKYIQFFKGYQKNFKN